MSGGALPNLLVIGAAKCGTSSLHYYLGLHPQIQMSQPKELSYFIDRAGYEPEPYMSEPQERHVLAAPANWGRGLDWYRAHFDPDSPVRGESTVAYSFPWYTNIADRIAEVVPEARLVYLVRDPVERTVSHHRQYVHGGREWRSLDEVLGDMRNPYVGASRYATVLGRFLEAFPRERVLVLRRGELLEQREATLAAVFRFLGVDESFRSRDFDVVRNRSEVKGRFYRAAERLRHSRAAAPIRRLPVGARVRIERLLAGAIANGAEPAPAVEPGLRERLLAELEPEIGGLERLTGLCLDDWRGVPA